MTKVRISSKFYSIDEVRELRWSKFADLDIHRSVSVEAYLVVKTPRGDIRLGFVKGGPLSETGMNIELIEVRDEEGVTISADDFTFSIAR